MKGKYKLNKQEKLEIAINIFGFEKGKDYVDLISPLIDGITRMKNHSYTSDNEKMEETIKILHAQDVRLVILKTFEKWKELK